MTHEIDRDLLFACIGIVDAFATSCHNDAIEHPNLWYIAAFFEQEEQRAKRILSRLQQAAGIETPVQEDSDA